MRPEAARAEKVGTDLGKPSAVPLWGYAGLLKQ
jgi:hypothetical protein